MSFAGEWVRRGEGKHMQSRRIRASGQRLALAAFITLALGACGGGGGADSTPVATAPSAVETSPAAGAPPSASGPAAPGGTSTTSAPATAGSASSSPTSAASSAASSTSASSSSSTNSSSATPAVVAHYALGPVAIVDPTRVAYPFPTDYQTLLGMLPSVDGGYSTVWMTAAFDAAGQVQRSYFRQLYDATGHPIGGKTSIAAPAPDMGSALSASMAAGRIDAADGGYFLGSSTYQKVPLRLQHYAADGTAIDDPVDLHLGLEGYYLAHLLLPGGAVALTWQNVTRVDTGSLFTALLVPGAH